MRKKYKNLYVFIITIMFGITMFSSNVLAHSLTPLAKMYTKQKAGGYYHFAIGDWYHPNGKIVSYYWANSTVKSYFSTAIVGGINMWDGIIGIKETESKNAQMKVSYNPNIAADTAAYVVCTLPSNGHYEPGGVTTEMVIGNITKYSQTDKNKVLGHELGHVWGMEDLYDVNKNLSSIYANPYFYPKATQGDRNGIHICLNNPWYYASGPDRRAKYQKAPGVWAKNETLIINGKSCRFDANGFLVE